MASLLEYFKKDFKELSISNNLFFNYTKKDIKKGTTVNSFYTIKQNVIQGTESSTRLFTYYIPKIDDTFAICKLLLKDLDKRKEEFKNFDAIGGFTGDVDIGKHSVVYSNRIIIYSESGLNKIEIEDIEKLANNLGLYITIRSQTYLKMKTELEKPFAFISHDSRDKELIAKPLSRGLNSRLCFVWYDEYSLKVGVSLRESIEEGIKKAKKCVLILTPNFLSNSGWSKKEFNSIFTREMILNERIILPIWYEVTKEDIYNYSPSLADTYALIWPNFKNLSKEDYNTEVETLISKLHTEIMRIE